MKDACVEVENKNEPKASDPELVKQDEATSSRIKLVDYADEELRSNASLDVKNIDPDLVSLERLAQLGNRQQKC